MSDLQTCARSSDNILLKGPVASEVGIRLGGGEGGLSRGVRGGQTRRPVGRGVSHLLAYTIAPDLLDDHLYVLAVRVGAGSL